MDKPSDFKIIPYKGKYVIYNMKVDKKVDASHHTHIDNRHICKLIIKLVCDKVVPNKPYLRESARRISRDELYREEIERDK